MDGIASVLAGNRSHMARLEAVRLQIVALQAIEAQLVQWVDQQHAEKEEAGLTLTGEDMHRIAAEMARNGLDRASPQSAKWAGYAVMSATPDTGKSTTQNYKHAARVLAAMVDAGVIKHDTAVDKKKHRDVPIYTLTGGPQA